jgi:hypothetical protein
MERVPEALKKLNVLAEMQASMPFWATDGGWMRSVGAVFVEPPVPTHPVPTHRLQRMRDAVWKRVFSKRGTE